MMDIRIRYALTMMFVALFGVFGTVFVHKALSIATLAGVPLGMFYVGKYAEKVRQSGRKDD